MITKLIIIYTNLMLAQIHDIVTRKKAPPLHKKVFSLSKEVTPFLKGSFGPIYGKSIVISNPDSHIEIKRVYDSLAKKPSGSGKSILVNPHLGPIKLATNLRYLYLHLRIALIA
jgi:hypothetical protein